MDCVTNLYRVVQDASCEDVGRLCGFDLLCLVDHHVLDRREREDPDGMVIDHLDDLDYDQHRDYIDRVHLDVDLILDLDDHGLVH